MANQATSFREARAENFRAVLLQTAHFAEQITYLPADGGAPVVLTAIVVNERISRQEAGEVSGREDVLHVTLSADPGAVDADGNPLGGVAEPMRGDAIHRSGLGDGPDVQYAFEGNVLARNDYRWRLEFVRVEIQRVGLTGR